MKNSVVKIFFGILSVIFTACGDASFEKHNAPEMEDLTVSVNGAEAHVSCRLSSRSGIYTSYGFEYWKDDSGRMTVSEEGFPGEEFSCVIKGLEYDSDYEICAYVCNGERRYDFPAVGFRTDPDVIDGEFSDEAFLQYCISAFDADGDGHLSRNEAGGVTSLMLNGYKTQALTDLDKFSNLDSLWLLRSSVSALDLSGCGSLSFVKAAGVRMTSLALPETSHIISLDVSDNSLTEIRLDGCSALESLDCTGNWNLSDLDISPVRESLRTLKCEMVSVADLNLDGCRNLEELYFSNAEFAESAVSLDGCTKLKVLTAGNVKGAVSFSCFPALEVLDMSYCSAQQEFDLSANAALRELKVVECPSLKDVEVSRNVNLKKAVLWYTGLRTLDFSGCPALEEIDCRYNSSLVSVTLPATNGVTVKKDSGTVIEPRRA